MSGRVIIFGARACWRWGVGACALALAGALRAQPSEATCRVRVAEARAGIYAATNAAREAVAWAPAGAELEVVGELPEEGWVRVVPAERVSVWVYRELVRDGVVAADKSRIRAGAGLNFRAVGSLAKGERVEVRGTFGDWVKIRPPAGMAFWMLRDQVEPLAFPSLGGGEGEAEAEVACATNAPGGEVTNATAAVVTAPAAPRPEPPPELSGFALEEGVAQGERVALTGLLDWGAVGPVPARFALVARGAEGDVPLCHLLASEEACGALIGEAVAVEGARWRVKGAALPVVIPARVRATE